MDTITFRCDKQTKDEVTQVFNKYEINLSQALYMFMKQSILQQKYQSFQMNLIKKIQDHHIQTDFLNYLVV